MRGARRYGAHPSSALAALIWSPVISSRPSRLRRLQLHPGLVAVSEHDAGKFESGTHSLEVRARDEQLGDATLRTLDGMRRDSRLLGEFGLPPPEQLPRRPDLSARDHFPAFGRYPLRLR